MNPAPYRGRFAPSPTGPLHFGSLVAALASALEATTHAGEWRLRIDDLDRARTMRGAADEILRTLETFGFGWDGAVTYQSERLDRYASTLDRLQAGGLVYWCGCSRREIADSRADGATASRSLVYPGICRGGLNGRPQRALRVRTDATVIAFADAIQGDVRQAVEEEVGDFVVRRADGDYAYQLAVVVDDADQGITDIVRGADLLDSTPRQIHLQRLLGLPTPRYAHVPVVATAAGDKLSKQTGAQPLDSAHANRLLVEALRFLGQDPAPALGRARVREVWEWARANWRLAAVPRRFSARPPTDSLTDDEPDAEDRQGHADDGDD